MADDAVKPHREEWQEDLAIREVMHLHGETEFRLLWVRDGLAYVATATMFDDVSCQPGVDIEPMIWQALNEKRARMLSPPNTYTIPRRPNA